MAAVWSPWSSVFRHSTIPAVMNSHGTTVARRRLGTSGLEGAVPRSSGPAYPVVLTLRTRATVPRRSRRLRLTRRLGMLPHLHHRHPKIQRRQVRVHGHGRFNLGVASERLGDPGVDARSDEVADEGHAQAVEVQGLTTVVLEVVRLAAPRRALRPPFQDPGRSCSGVTPPCAAPYSAARATTPP